MIWSLIIVVVGFSAAWNAVLAAHRGLTARSARTRLGLAGAAVAAEPRIGGAEGISALGGRLAPWRAWGDGPAQRIGARLLSGLPPACGERWRRRLERAGLADRWSLLLIVGYAAELGVLLSLALGLLVPGHTLGFLLGAAMGLAAPACGVWCVRRRRTEGILRALPHAMELLALAAAAGSEFMTALTRVVECLAPGPLRTEWQRLLQVLRLGQLRAAALRAMAERVDLPAMTAMATALVQAERLGTPLAAILQAQAQYWRFERIQRAERCGAAASQKILLPIVCCILPAFVLLVLGGVLLGLTARADVLLW
ncbi:MAG: type II secretion system F family protein [Deltaproteobacteria bacterium]|nr:type II secretion system F family protein [Deltaproteobacteria bacterium]